jgi:prevent-host-death family protein
MKVSVYEAKSKLSQMISKALEGEEVVITRHGHETVKLVPVNKKRKWIGMWKGKIKVHDSFYEPLDEETLAYFTGDAETFLDKTMKKRRDDEEGGK